ncbi:MAG: sulfotransferase domain-containing protein [Saprospiraceae bacterium]|nr:sulfotransferase domain-containing protein [Saprospiraceae bacterium]
MKEQDQIFAVYGPSKSGTTWLQSILDSHPEVRCHFQLQLFPFLKETGVVAVRSKAVMSQFSSPFKSVFKDKKAEQEYWVRLRYFQALRPTLLKMVEELKARFPKPEDQEYLQELIRETYRAIAPHFLEDDPEAKISGFKSTTDLEFFLDVFPNAKVITILRDGRDVATSKRFHMQKRGAYYLGDEKHKWFYWLNSILPIRIAISKLRRRFGWFGKKHFHTYTNDNMQFSKAALEKFSSDWALTTQYIMRYKEKYPAHFHVIRYEELKANPQKYIAALLEFIGVSADEETIQEILQATDFSKMKGDDKQGFFRKGITGDWANYFSEKDKAIFKSCTGSLLVDLGYEKDNNW